MKKRFLVLILLLLLVAALPVAANAATRSGACGDNLTWTLDDSGVLTISGTGPMLDYSTAYGYTSDNAWDELTTAPWGVTAKKLVIQNGVTSIGAYAFFHCDKLTSVTIPDSVTSIGLKAFTYCESLAGIPLPDHVTSLQPLGATVICNEGTATEEACKNANQKYEYYEPLSGQCGDSVTWTLSDSGVLTISGTGPMYAYKETHNSSWDVYTTAPWSYKPTKIVIKSGVTSIGDYAFDGCSQLTSVTIPSTVKTIGKYAFYYCDALTGITIPSGVTVIDNYAFWGSGLTSVSIPNTVQSINARAFSCSDLTSVTLPNTLTSIAESAFSSTPLQQITLPNNLTDLGGYAFSDCRSLKSIAIPSGVTVLNDSTFEDCKSLSSVTLPNGLTDIGGSCFSGCSSLASIALPETVSSMGASAFRLSGLTSISIPSGVTRIETSCFRGCGSLKSVALPNTLTGIDEDAFRGCSALTAITLPQSMTWWGNYVFKDCSSLKTITLPNGLDDIGWNTFEGCSALTSITMDGVWEIHSEAFSGCTSLKTVRIPAQETIWERTFKNCTSLTSVTLPDGVKTIKTGAFSGCTNLTKIVIPASVTAIDSSAFYGCGNALTIYCYEGSAAHTFAVNNSLKVVLLEAAPTAAPTITKQPASKTVAVGATVTFELTATGASSYQWYYRKSSAGSWIPVSNDGTFASYSLTTGSQHNGYQFRCQVSNSLGNVYSNTVTLTISPKPVITAQPANTTVNEGATATFKVTASGATGYQWYYRKSASDAWVTVKNSGTSNTYNLVTASYNNGYQFRCLVKNAAGSVYTNTVTLKVLTKPTITAQPTDKTVNAGETASFKVTASKATSYQWYYRKSASDAWVSVKNNGTAATYNLVTATSNNGYQFRCLVKNADGSLYSNTVTLKVTNKPTITAQPTDKTVNAGETATFKVTASKATSYQWYYRKSASDAWIAVQNNGTSSTYNLITIASHNGYQFRCLVKNADGSLYSNTVTLKVTNKPTITAQPTDKTVNAGETATFKVTASKATSYQWYYRKTASSGWISVKNNGTSATYNLVTIAANNGYQFRCLVKNTDGGVYSNTVTLKVTNKPVITAQPTDKTVNAGETATFKVTASKATSYQWYYRKSASDAWIAVQNNGTSSTYNLTTIASHNGYQFRCLVKNADGSLYSNTVTLKVTNKPTITAQPTDKTVNAGETATFKVTASKATAYQWYYRKTASSGWISVKNNGTSATYNLVTIAANNGYQFRCEAKNDEGTAVSNIVTLTVK